MIKNNLLASLFLRKRNRRKNKQLLQINTPDRIIDYSFVEIGGIQQWITIRGENKSNPVLLFIHGGPASTYSIFSPWLRAWEKDFTLVQWDQRGAGKTFSKNGKQGSGNLSFERLAQDGIEVAQFLCQKLQQEKVILIASSAGSLSGILMAKQRPDLFYAYVGTDQNAPDPQQLWYQLALKALNAAGNAKGVHLLEKMGSIRTEWKRQDFMQLNQFMVKATKDVPNMISDLMIPAMLQSPDHSIKDLIDLFRGMSFSLEYLFDELINFNFNKPGRDFELPFFIFQGDSDLFTPAPLAEAYYNEIKAPYKEFVLLKHAGHLACFAQTDQFFKELIDKVRPLACSKGNVLL